MIKDIHGFILIHREMWFSRFVALCASLTEKVCSTDPLKAFRTRIIPPLVEMRICFPSLLNLSPVQSQTRLNLASKEAKGPFSQKDVIHYKYSLTDKTITQVHEGQLPQHTHLHFTLSKARRSYNLIVCDSTPAANISPSGSKEHTGFPSGLVKPWNTNTHVQRKRVRSCKRKSGFITKFEPSSLITGVCVIHCSY